MCNDQAVKRCVREDSTTPVCPWFKEEHVFAVIEIIIMQRIGTCELSAHTSHVKL